MSGDLGGVGEGTYRLVGVDCAFDGRDILVDNRNEESDYKPSRVDYRCEWVGGILTTNVCYCLPEMSRRILTIGVHPTLGTCREVHQVYNWRRAQVYWGENGLRPDKGPKYADL
eukprot:750942-Hanusia_phi.AAC.4